MILIDNEIKIATNPLMGLGVFSLQHIASGSLVWEFTTGIDIKISKQEFNQLNVAQQNHFKKYGWREFDYYYSSCDASNFINHSSTPNLDCTQFNIYALRDIDIGEELFVNYQEFDDDFYEYKHELI